MAKTKSIITVKEMQNRFAMVAAFLYLGDNADFMREINKKARRLKRDYIEKYGLDERIAELTVKSLMYGCICTAVEYLDDQNKMDEIIEAYTKR